MTKYTLLDLPYAYDALEPHISREVMQLHHDRHHRTYVDKLNEALESKLELQQLTLKELLSRDDIDETTRIAVRNHGGGHYNHSLFWTIMGPVRTEPSEALRTAIELKYGSMSRFVEVFTKAALSLFGSGWVWLSPSLEIISMPNQDNPLMFGGAEPLFGLDVWEHAYYLDYRNKRDDYIKNWWDIVNWIVISDRYRELN